MLTGARMVPARYGELSQVLKAVGAAGLGALDPSVARTMGWPFGRAVTAWTLPLTGAASVVLMSLEPAGLILLRRTDVSARILALAVPPDMRRRGLARFMLDDAAARAAGHDLRWLWALVPSSNAPATRCALACGFQRFRPQRLRREIGGRLPVRAPDVALELQAGPARVATLTQWLGAELAAGDLWIRDLIEAELAPLVMPRSGRVWSCAAAGREIGCAHVEGPIAHPVVTLWLDQPVWNTPVEVAALKCVLDRIESEPARLDLRFGSTSHLRASAEHFKALHFEPVMEERVLFARATPRARRRGAQEPARHSGT